MEGQAEFPKGNILYVQKDWGKIARRYFAETVLPDDFDNQILNKQGLSFLKQMKPKRALNTFLIMHSRLDHYEFPIVLCLFTMKSRARSSEEQDEAREQLQELPDLLEEFLDSFELPLDVLERFLTQTARTISYNMGFLEFSAEENSAILKFIDGLNSTANFISEEIIRKETQAMALKLLDSSEEILDVLSDTAIRNRSRVSIEENVRDFTSRLFRSSSAGAF